MSYIFQLIIYSAQIIIFQFFASSHLSTLAYKQSLGRNKEWVLNNRSIMEEFPAPRSFIHYIFGALFLIVLFYGSFTGNKTAISVAHHGSVILFVIQHAVIDLIRGKKITTKIPAPEMRSADLTPREFKRYIPNYITALVGTIVVTFVVGWIHLYSIGKIELVQFRAVLTSNLIVYAVLIPTLIYCLRRKSINSDAGSAKMYRAYEIYVIFIIFSAFAVNSLLMCLGYYFDIKFFMASKQLRDYIFTSIPMIAFVWFMLNKNFRALINEKF